MRNDVEVMKAYLILKLDQGDWHGVSDAANDLREMQARHGNAHDEQTEKLVGQIIHMAQTIHQAHHSTQPGDWISCTAPLCRDARYVLKMPVP